jgi:hypothetical protein
LAEELLRSLAVLTKRWLVAASIVGAILATQTRVQASPSSTTTEQGYDLGEVQHPRTVAMAGANQVFGGSTQAIFANPANLSLYRVYHLEGLAAFSPEARRQSYGGAVVDSSTSKLAGGFGGTWSQMDPDGIKRTWTDLRLTLAYPLGDRFHVGVTGRYLRLTQPVDRGPFGPSLASDGKPSDPLTSSFTFDAGAAIAITEGLRVAISGRNLTVPGNGLAPTSLVGGAGWSNQTISVEANSLVDFNTYSSARTRAMVGGEVLVADHIPLRGGYRYDAGTKSHALSLGAGYVDKRFSVDLAGRRDIVAEHPSTMISIGLRFFIDSNGTTQQNEADPL